MYIVKLRMEFKQISQHSNVFWTAYRVSQKERHPNFELQLSRKVSKFEIVKIINGIESLNLGIPLSNSKELLVSWGILHNFASLHFAKLVFQMQKDGAKVQSCGTLFCVKSTTWL